MKYKSFLPLNLRFFGEQDPPPTNEPETSDKLDGNPSESSLLQITQEDLDRMIAKEKGNGKQSIYAKLGIKDDAGLADFISKFEEIKKAEEEAEKNKPELERLRGELDAKSKIEDELKAVQEKLAGYELSEIIRSKGVVDSKEAKLAKYEIREIIASGKNMAEAAEEYFKANPPEVNTGAPPKPNFYPNTPPSDVNTKMTKEEFDKLTYLKKLEFKLKDPEKFTEFTKR